MEVYNFLLVMGILFCFIEMLIFSSKKSNAAIIINKINALVYLIFLTIIFSYNRQNGDYLNYKNFFEMGLDNMERGFSMLCKIIKKVNGSYEIVVFIIGIVLFAIMKKIFLKKSSYKNLILFLYFLYPSLIDLNQIRNFLMISCVYISLNFLIQYKILRAYFFVFISLFFHKLGVIYFVFLYLSRFSIKKYKKYVKKLVLINIILNNFIIIILLKIYPLKISSYLKRKPKFGILLILIYLILDIYIINYISKKIKNKVKNKKERRMQEIFYKFIYFSIIITPYLMYFLEIKRIERNSLIIKYVYCASALKYLNFKRKIFVVCFLILSSIIPLMVICYEKTFFYFTDIGINYVVELISKR